MVRTHRAEVYRYVRYMGAGWQVAEDLDQETFLAACRSTHPVLRCGLDGLAGQERTGLRSVRRAHAHSFLRDSSPEASPKCRFDPAPSTRFWPLEFCLRFATLPPWEEFISNQSFPYDPQGTA